MDSSLILFSQFRFWFDRINQTTFRVIQLNTSEGSKEIGTLVETDSSVDIHIEGVPGETTEAVNSIILEDFMIYRDERPEYLVGKKASFLENAKHAHDVDSNKMIEFFESVMLGAYNLRIIRNGGDPDKFYSGFESILDWIRKTDLYTGPASTIYHDSEPFGLLFHTLKVYNNAIDIRELEKFKSVDLVSLTVCTLCHDFTKINNYEYYLRNVKNDDTGKWEQVPAYKRKPSMIPLGHGIASAYIANNFFKLNLEEWLAIRWHMGEYMCANGESSELEDSMDNYPLVLLLQFADRLACVNY